MIQNHLIARCQPHDLGAGCPRRTRDATDICWVEATDAVEHTAFHSKQYVLLCTFHGKPSANVQGAEVLKHGVSETIP